MWLVLVLIFIATLLLYKLLYPSKPFWEEYGVPQINTSNFAGKLQLIFGKKTFADFDDVAYQQLKSSGGKFCGVVEMGLPFLIVKDLEIIKKVLIKDFDHFVDRRQFVGSKTQKIMSKVVGNLEGEEWKGVRSSLSPAFTTGKIRRMMEHFNNVGSEWIQHFKQEINKNGGKDAAAPLPINVPMETTNFTVDAIAAAVFGMNAGTIRNPQSGFAKMAKQLSDFTPVQVVKFLIAGTFPWILDILGIPLLNGEAVTFFENILAQGMKERMEGKIKMNDFIQLVVEARKGELKSEGSDELSSFEKEAQLSGGDSSSTPKRNYLSDDEIANAQALGFFFAGFSTTSNFIGFALYMLALHPEVQDKLREELDSKLFINKGEGDDKNIDYDELNGLVYLDMVVCEVLRKFPPANRLERKCVKEYHDTAENLRVPKGAMVGVPIQSIHDDKEYYERPDQFYPEHFSPENKAKRSPYAFLAFGIGPRNCIGMRFALVESKAAIAHLVHSFKFEPTAKTPIPAQVKKLGLGVQLPNNLELGIRLLP